MNNTTKAKYELAEKMLKGHIEPEEVAIMAGIPLEEVEKLKEKVTPNNTEVEILKNLDFQDFNIGEILEDNLPADASDIL